MCVCCCCCFYVGVGVCVCVCVCVCLCVCSTALGPQPNIPHHNPYPYTLRPLWLFFPYGDMIFGMIFIEGSWARVTVWTGFTVVLQLEFS